MYSASTRNHGFEEEDDELVSLLAMEAGFSGYAHYNSQFSRSPSVYQDSSDKQPSSSSLHHSLSSSSSRPARFFGRRYEDRRPVYFLGFCFLCMKRLCHGEDIFMYRDSAYCSEECRERTMEIDEPKHRKLYKFSSTKKEERKSIKNLSIQPDKVAAA